jgi:hypothetical protein
MWFWFFVVSLLINFLLLIYTRWLIVSLGVVNEDIEGLTEMINDYVSHVKQVYELQMFYGDDTLKSLLEHGSKLTTALLDLDLLLNEKGEDLADKEETQTTNEE